MIACQASGEAVVVDPRRVIQVSLDLAAQHGLTITARHTPEHLSYLITDGAVADEPGFSLTGDFVFSGDLGRPDLLDEAVGMER